MSTRRPLAKLQAVAAANGISEKMSKSEIQSWAQRVHGGDDEGGFVDWESLDEKWDDFLKYAQLQVLSGKTKIRAVFLQERLLPLAARGGERHAASPMPNRQPLTNCTQDLDQPRTIDVLKLLILTYPRYIDSVSRDAVVGVLKTMVQRDEERGKSSAKLGLCRLRYLFVVVLILP